MYTMRVISICSAACLVAAVLVGSGVARADDCLAASDSAIAQAKVPHADTHVTIEPGKAASRVEMIFVADKVYTRIEGGWQSTAYSAQQQIDAITAANGREAQTPHTCRKLSSTPINGEATSLLVMHVETNGKGEDARVWISDKTGLPWKSEVHLADGTVFTDDFRYGNIVVPPGAK
jgi:hypothetical protein